MKNIEKNLELRVLNKISTTIVRERNVGQMFKDTFNILSHELNIERGTLTLKRGNELFIEASHGLSSEERRRGKYALGEGVTGQVAMRGEAITIPNISQEPAFLYRTGVKRVAHGAFICVPIKSEGDVIGTLSIELLEDDADYLEQLEFLLSTVANIMANAAAAILMEIEEHEKLVEENQRLKIELNHHFIPENMIGTGSQMREIFVQVGQVAESPATVLITGESGTGKELIARAIHNASPRKNNPFIAVNCGALPENLVESELFGHEKGAFTGAVERRKGRCELSDGGTLFLDEIGDISIPVQVKLLRFLQEKTFQRVGGSIDINVDVRIIAATSRNLEDYIANDRFREDLYYRLNVFPIHLPNLRKRRTDIIPLAEHFLEKFNKMYGKNIKRISTPAINMLLSYHWPGNVRELENCIERVVLTTQDEVIRGYNMPPSLQTAQATNTTIIPEDNSGVSLETMMELYEKELIIDALKNHRGNVAATSRFLKSTPRIIHYKIKQLKIDPSKFKL
ncbi:sigma 54-interacting transcriptional regulator [Lentisphaerota bacterium WC36G]|nr:sigma 54-interacting transcriptional regulator [Lentisphaerae bacterium WC36]